MAAAPLPIVPQHFPHDGLAFSVLKSLSGQRAPLKTLDVSELVPALNPTLVIDGAGLEKVRNFLSRVSVFGFDYETNIVPTFFHRKARTLQLGDKNEQYIIDLLAFAGSTEALIQQQGHFGTRATFFSPIKKVLVPALQSQTHLKVGHNLQFEYEVSKWCLGMRPWNFYDTQLAERCIFLGLLDAFETQMWGLEDVVRRWCRLLIDKSEQKQFDLESPLTESQIIYCALDARLPLAVKNGQYKELTVTNLHRVVQIENDAIPAYGDMMLNGFYLNPVAWRTLSENNQAQLKQIITEMDRFFVPLVGTKAAPDLTVVASLETAWRELDKVSLAEEAINTQIATTKGKEAKDILRQQRNTLAEERKVRKAEARASYTDAAKQVTRWKKESPKWEGEACINYGSTAQLHDALLEGRFGFTKTSLPNTNDKTLEKHAEKPVVKLLRKYRTLSKLIDTYGESWLRLRTDPDSGYTDPDTGRIHARQNQMGTDTGRGSCGDPNLQNIPKLDEYRACFQSRHGHKLCTVDYNGQELRIAAELSHERAWIEAFNKDWDVHSVCAEILYSVKWKATQLPDCAFYQNDHKKCECPDHKEMRGWLKNINFGIIYGKGPWALAADLEISLDEAEAMLMLYRRTLPQLWDYLERVGEQAYMRLESRSMSQRRRLYSKPDWEQATRSAIKKFKIPEGERPNEMQIKKQYSGIIGGIKRQGKNMPVQSTGADMVKLAYGCGFDERGNPYLWHRLEPEFGGLLENLVHDEGVAEVPDAPDVEVSPFYIGTGIVEGNANLAFAAMVDAMQRAGKEFIKTIPMPADGHCEDRWRK